MTALPMPREEIPLLWPAPAWRTVFVLLVLLALLPCERVVAHLLRVPFYGSGRSYNIFVLTSAQLLRALAAGVLADAFGIRRVLALGLIAWCVLTTAAALVTDRLGLTLLDLSTSLSFGPYSLMIWVVIGSCLPRLGRALPLVIVVVASRLSLLAVPVLTTFVFRHTAVGNPEAVRQVVAFFFVSIGAVVTFVWLVLGPMPLAEFATPVRRDMTAACEGLIRLLGDRLVWRLLLLFALAAFAFEVGYYRFDRFLAQERGIGVPRQGVVAYSPYIAGIAGDLVAAVASNRWLARAGSPADARRPFIVAGFLLAAGMGLLPILPQDDLIAMSCVAGLGFGLQSALAFLALDIAPLRHLGALAAIIVAVGDLMHVAVYETSAALYPLAHSYGPILAVGGATALTGGVLATWLLREVAPLEGATP